MASPPSFPNRPSQHSSEGADVARDRASSSDEDPFDFQPILDPPLPINSQVPPAPEDGASGEEKPQGDGHAAEEDESPLVVASPLTTGEPEGATPERESRSAPRLFSIKRFSGSSTSGSATLMVALALVLLVFFIVLIALSRADRLRKEAVLDSLRKTFATMGAPLEVETLARPDAMPTPIKSFQQQISEILSREIPSARVRMMQSGDTVVALFPAEVLFSPQTADLRLSRIRFIDSLVASLSAAPSGVLFKVEILVGTNYDSSKIGDTIQPLSRARAAAMAVRLLEQGAPPAAFAIGAVGGKAEMIKMTFAVADAVQKGEGGSLQGSKQPPNVGQGTAPVGGGKAK